MTDNIYDKYKALGIDKKVYDLCESEWEKLSLRFKKIDDIKNVTGIGDSLFEKIKDQITV